MVKFFKLLRTVIAVIALSTSLTTGARGETVLDAVQSVERNLDARVGFYMHDTHTGDVITYAENDRFPLNSTFKLLACGVLLSQAERGTTNLTDTVSLLGAEIVSYSPAIKDAIRSGRREITLDDACRMMLSVSDNTAANLILSEIGGPEGVTAFLRSIGDQVTRLDRWETSLNEAVPDDPRDTTSPRAIAISLQKLLMSDVLSSSSRATLREWLSAHSVADALFRAALPETWSIDDRTGAGGYGSRSIIAVIYPPNRLPIIVTLFMTETNASFSQRNAAAARIGKAIVGRVEHN